MAHGDQAFSQAPEWCHAVFTQSIGDLLGDHFPEVADHDRCSADAAVCLDERIADALPAGEVAVLGRREVVNQGDRVVLLASQHVFEAANLDVLACPISAC